MKGSSSCYAGGLLLAATLATAEKASVIAPTPTHTMRNLQDVPAVGVGFEAGDSSIVISGSRTSSTATAVTEELIDALEQDDQVTGKMSTRRSVPRVSSTIALVGGS